MTVTTPTLEDQNRLLEKAFKEANKDYTTPDKVTVRLEYIKCRKARCTKCSLKGTGKHVYGPYFYAYWKENGKLRKRYVGKSLEDYTDKMKVRAGLMLTHGHPVGPTSNLRQINQFRKIQFILEQEKKGDDIIKKYADKYNKLLITCDWAYRKIKERNIERYWDKIRKIAKKQGVNLGNQWIGDKYMSWRQAHRSYARKLFEESGLEMFSEFENWLDSYINTEFR